jgi:hypothetical protein
LLVQDDHHGLLEAGQGAGPDARRRVGQADLDDVEVEDVDIVEVEDVDVAAAAAAVVVVVVAAAAVAVAVAAVDEQQLLAPSFVGLTCLVQSRAKVSQHSCS